MSNNGCTDCGDTNLPQVNEEALKCCELTPADCVVTTKYHNFFKIGVGKTLTFVIDTIAKFVKVNRLRIDALEALNNYRPFTAILNQAGTSAPTATVVYNGLGGTATPVWGYTSAGKYTLTITGAFPVDKTIIELKDFDIGWGEKVKAYRVDDDTIAIESGSSTDFIDDDVITNMPIEIKVYD